MLSMKSLKLLGAVCVGFFINFMITTIPQTFDQYFGIGGAVPAADLVMKSLARRVYAVQRTIQKEAEIGGKASEDWTTELEAVVFQLYPRLIHEPDFAEYSEEIEDKAYAEYIKGAKVNKTLNDGNVNEAITKTQRTENKSKLNVAHSKSLNICSKVSSPDLENINFLQYDCSKVEKFGNVISVVLLTKYWTVNRIKLVIEKLLEYYHVDIYITMFNYEKIGLEKYKDHVKPFYFSELDTFGKAMRQINPYIRTPYTFISHNLDYFSNETSPLETLILPLEEIKGVSIAAGAYRDPLGMWDHGCFQTLNRNYFLTYTKGYLYSKQGCMFCDDVLGPFVAKTNIVQSIEFSEELDGQALFHEWFIKVRMEGKEIISCLHAMFLTNTTQPTSRHDWRLIATRWKLQDIRTHENISHHFTCPEVSINCFFIRQKISSYLVPPCCIEARTKELEFVTDCAKSLNLEYQLVAGSMIGPVKLDEFLLWDFDNDLRVVCNKMDVWLSKGRSCLSNKGCGIKVIRKSYFVVKCPLTDLDVVCRGNLTIGLPYEYSSVSTKIEVRSRSWKTMPNPGLSSLLKYGTDYLRHAVHWRYKSDVYVSSWNPCKTPDNRSCLDQLPTDGSIPFKRPFPNVIGEAIYT